MSVTTSSTLLELIQIHKEYPEPSGKLEILKGLSLIVRRGGIHVITGPSGSGKTTLLQICGCLIRPTQGRVIFAGMNLAEVDESDCLLVRRRHLGFAFQHDHLLQALTVYDNVALGLRWKRLAVDHNRIMHVLELLGIQSKAWKLPRHLSGGERQRAALARALVGSPELLLADEPTSQLDSDSATTVSDLLREAAREANTAVLLTTHDQRLHAIGDRIFALKNGKLYG